MRPGRARTASRSAEEGREVKRQTDRQAEILCTNYPSISHAQVLAAGDMVVPPDLPPPAHESYASGVARSNTTSRSDGHFSRNCARDTSCPFWKDAFMLPNMAVCAFQLTITLLVPPRLT